MLTGMGRIDTGYFLARRISSRGVGRGSVMVRIATVSVIVSVAVMIVSLGVIFGFKDEISRKLIGFGAHLQIVNLDGNVSYETVPVSRDQPFLEDIRRVKDFSGIYPYAIKAGIMRGDDAMQGVVLKGVDGSYDWTFFRESLREGELPAIADSARTKDVLISQALADMMSVGVGDRMEMLFIQEPPRRDLFVVKGIYDTQFEQLDEVMVLTDIRNVQRLNGWDASQITGFEVTTSSFKNLDRFDDDVFQAIDDNPSAEDDLRVVTIRERYPMIFDWLATHDVNAAVIITVMLIVALFNMISALLIILLERTSMIGVLKALGMGNPALQRMFVIRSSFVILKGMFWGNVIGIGLCLLQHYTGLAKLDQGGYFLTTVPIYINWGWLALLNVITFAFLVALLVLPTMVISRIMPEKTIRYE